MVRLHLRRPLLRAAEQGEQAEPLRLLEAALQHWQVQAMALRAPVVVLAAAALATARRYDCLAQVLAPEQADEVASEQPVQKMQLQVAPRLRQLRLRQFRLAAADQAAGRVNESSLVLQGQGQGLLHLQAHLQ